MTAEVAILNKSAVALAADSVVTFINQMGQKNYNTVDKLFKLSDYQPVGVMIFGNSEFMGMPWEIIISTFKQKLKKEKFSKLEDYSNKFISFLTDSKQQLIPPNLQNDFFRTISKNNYMGIKKSIEEEVKSANDDKKLKTIATNFIIKYYNDWEKSKDCIFLSKEELNELIKENKNYFQDYINKEFIEFKLDNKIKEKLLKIIYFWFSKENSYDQRSGIVIAGYGDKEYFPSTISYCIDFMIKNKLKIVNKEIWKINTKTNGIIRAFAQREMVATFVEGIDPRFKRMLEVKLNEKFSSFSNDIINSLEDFLGDKKSEYKEKLKEYFKSQGEDLTSQLQNYLQNQFVVPLLSSVGALPQNELALMAETFVYLTSFKQKISQYAETVGEPIDVAVISKSNGFVWIKHKKYFTNLE